MPFGRREIPHLVTASRLLVVAAAYAAAAWREPVWVVALGLLAVGTDILDGILARRWNVTSAFGANLDSAADFTFYTSLIVWVWMFDPGVILTLRPWIAVFLPAYVITLALAKARRGTMGFHNAWTRTAATVGVSIALWTIAFGWHPLFLPALLVGLTADLGQRLTRIFLPRTKAAGIPARR